MKIKIITLNEAIKLGLSNSKPQKITGQGGLQPRYAYVAAGKIGSDKALEVRRIDLKTKEETIVFEDPEYKKEKKELEEKEHTENQAEKVDNSSK